MATPGHWIPPLGLPLAFLARGLMHYILLCLPRLPTAQAGPRPFPRRQSLLPLPTVPAGVLRSNNWRLEPVVKRPPLQAPNPSRQTIMNREMIMRGGPPLRTHAPPAGIRTRPYPTPLRPTQKRRKPLRLQCSRHLLRMVL